MDREPAYADAVAALLDATPQMAVELFDAVLAEAVDAGLDVAMARTLRWHHRESLRAVRDHAATVLPPVIAGLVSSEASAALAPAVAPAAVPAAPLVAPPLSDDARRRTLVASLRALDESATA